MLTPHEAAVARLKLLNRAEHPEIEEVLAVARMYPVDVQAACADAMKRGGDPATVEPIKAVADRQAVEIQELLDALTLDHGRIVNAQRLAADGTFDSLFVAEPVMLFTADPRLPLSNEEEFFAQRDFNPLNPPVEPVVIASEPFKLSGELFPGQLFPPVPFDPNRHQAPAVEEAHEPLIPAAIGEGSATSVTDPTLSVHGDAGDSGGAHSGSL